MAKAFYSPAEDCVGIPRRRQPFHLPQLVRAVGAGRLTAALRQRGRSFELWAGICPSASRWDTATPRWNWRSGKPPPACAGEPPPRPASFARFVCHLHNPVLLQIKTVLASGFRSRHWKASLLPRKLALRTDWSDPRLMLQKPAIQGILAKTGGWHDPG